MTKREPQLAVRMKVAGDEIDIRGPQSAVMAAIERWMSARAGITRSCDGVSPSDVDGGQIESPAK